uniref:D7r2 salivary protein n=1 Tax=Anopheles cracens TaxID=123217 RepID=Q7YT43_9DIPT|nr:D7r2 salivary protein [Anopheles cracens]
MLERLFLSVGLVYCLISLGQVVTHRIVIYFKNELNTLKDNSILPNKQAREESTVEECEKNIPYALKDHVCELRKYIPVVGDDMDKHMQCVLEVIGFVTDSGEVKVNDLLSLLQKVDSNVNHAANVKKCVTDASSEVSAKKANTFYTCFLGTSSSPAFKNAVDYNELLKAGKMQSSEPFEEKRVAALIKEIDDGLCN